MLADAVAIIGTMVSGHLGHVECDSDWTLCSSGPCFWVRSCTLTFIMLIITSLYSEVDR